MSIDQPSLFNSDEIPGQAPSYHQGDAGIHGGDPYADGFVDFPFVRADQIEAMTAEPETPPEATPPVAKRRPSRQQLTAERLPLVLDRVGIVPRSTRELDLAAYALRARDEAPDQGFAGYLEPVSMRRTRDVNTADPVPLEGLSPEAAKARTERRQERVRRTMARIIGEVEGFAATSGKDAGFLRLLDEELAGDALVTGPQAVAYSENSLSSWQTSPDVRRALRAALHSEAAREALAAEEPVDLNQSVSDEMIREYLLTHTVEEVYAAIARARGEQVVRHYFWLNRLREAGRQGAAADIATAALRRVRKSD